MDDVNCIGSALAADNILVPGFIPGSAGFLSVEAIDFSHHQEGQSTILLPDRNIVSSIAKIARVGGLDPTDRSAAPAARLMAFCQAVNIDIEPSIAYHELGHRSGNTAAHEELSWFRAADEGRAQAWIDLALARVERITAAPKRSDPQMDFALPLGRWRRNYIAALKIAALELAPLTPVERAVGLIQWMFDDFILAGPSAAFATMYFSPGAPRRGMIKSVRSDDRKRAIAGVRNAAWDMTYLSEFVRHVQQGQSSGHQYILASNDRNLLSIAPLLLADETETTDQRSLERHLAEWWSVRDAATVSATIFGYIARIDEAWRRAKDGDNIDIIARLTAEGETHLWTWRA